jgi:hypothetical protein
MPDEKQISALLRLKRFEQPSPEYFDQFLKDFHRRQREELLRQSLWEIARERVAMFFSELRLREIGYAGATVGVLWLAGLSILQNFDSDPAANVATAGVRPSESRSRGAALSLQETGRYLETPELVSNRRMQSAPAEQPRYVMDARPASYEPPSSF